MITKEIEINGVEFRLTLTDQVIKSRRLFVFSLIGRQYRKLQRLRVERCMLR